MMKRLYHFLSLVALVLAFAATGFAGYLFASGRLNGERMNQIAKVLRGEYPREVAAAATQPAAVEAAPVRSAEEITRNQEKARYMELLAERHQRELEDRRRLNLEIKLDVDRKLEELASREKRLESEIAAARKEGEMEGFEKQLEFLSKAEPRRAKDLMKGQMKEADVVQLLMKMDANRVSKIVNVCKTEDELLWIGRILNQIGKLKEETATGVDGPSAQMTGR